MKSTHMGCLVLSAVLAGCSTMSVTVDILDPAYARSAVSEAELIKLIVDIESQGVRSASEPISKLRSKHAEAGESLFKAYQAYANTRSAAESAPLRTFADDLRKSIRSGPSRKEIDSAITAAEGAASIALREARDSQWNRKAPVPIGVRNALSTITETRSKWSTTLQAEIDEFRFQAQTLLEDSKSGTAASETAKVAVAQTESLQNYLKTVIAGPTLATSDYAYVVSQADEQNWSKRFNRAYASGTFGASDIVIKLNSQADFSVKGMRFDASTVASVASKVMTQALLVGAQMAGVPIPTSAGSGATGNGKQLADASGQLAADDELVAKRKAKIDAWRQAIREMATSILAEDNVLTGIANADWPTKKGAVIAPINGTKEALKPILSLQGLQ